MKERERENQQANVRNRLNEQETERFQRPINPTCTRIQRQRQGFLLQGAILVRAHESDTRVRAVCVCVCCKQIGWIKLSAHYNSPIKNTESNPHFIAKLYSTPSLALQF